MLRVHVEMDRIVFSPNPINLSWLGSRGTIRNGGLHSKMSASVGRAPPASLDCPLGLIEQCSGQSLDRWVVSIRSVFIILAVFMGVVVLV